MTLQAYTLPPDLRFELETEDPGAAAFFEGEYGWARGASEAGAVLTLRWSRALWPAREAADETAHTHKLLARWCYRVTASDGRLDVEIRGNRWALPMVHHMLVHQGLRYLAAGRGILFLHASAVERGGRSVLFTGPGGVGKTTTSSLILARGDVEWRVHADDYVIADPRAGRSYAYPTRAHVYADLLRAVPEMADRLTRRERLRAEFFGAVRTGSRGRLKWPTRVKLERLWPDRERADQAKVAAIVILDQGAEGERGIERIPPGEVPLEDLTQMNFFEARHFIHLLDEAGVWGESPGALDRWRESERGMLEQLTHAVPVWRLSVAGPGGPTANVGDLESMLLEAVSRARAPT